MNYVDGYDPLESFRRSQREWLNNIERITSPVINVPDFTNLYNFAERQQRMIDDSLNSFRNTISEMTRIKVPVFSMPKYNIPKIHTDDFRKSVVIQETYNDVESYQENTISVSEYSLLVSRVFNAEQKLHNMEERERMQAEKEQQDEELTVAEALSRLIILLGFFGVEFDYETIKFILESFVEFIHFKFDGNISFSYRMR